MKIVIELGEKALWYVKGGTLTTEVLDAIRNGTPLPKGHGRLIDADELEKKAEGTDDRYMVHEIDEAPTIIEADKEGENGE